MTPPSAKKVDVDSIFEKVRTEIPKAEVKETVEKAVYYRLIAGRFDDMGAAVRLRTELSAKNIPSFIMRSNKKFSVIVSSHKSEQLALDEQKQLAGRHINTRIVKSLQSLPHWQVTSGDSYELRDAVYAASVMTAKDIVTIIE